MSHQSDLIAQDILAYLEQHERKEILRFLTCGSVDDGKSTLIGRLLHDSKMIYEDQLEAVRSKKPGDDGEFDLALLTDGLQAEREQGITIDVAYRYFSTTKRKFIIADTPGHEQYTRNMATGASGCDVAVILIDARQGVLTQTRRHTFIAALLGIRHVIVAVNKMDLVDFDESVFDRIRSEYIAFTANLGIEDLQFIPISALRGDNVVEKSDEMPWYQGSTLMYLLENVQIASDRNFEDFRFAVQRVSRPDSSFRGYSGTVQSGIIRPGDQIAVLPSGKTSTVARIVTMDGDLRRSIPAARGNADADERSRHQPRRHAGEARQSAVCRRSIRRAARVDVGRSVGSRQAIHHQTRYEAAVRARLGDPPSRRHQHAGAGARRYVRAERNRPLRVHAFGTGSRSTRTRTTAKPAHSS